MIDHHATTNRARPAQVLVDLERLEPAGANGGIARFMSVLLPAVAQAARGAIRFTFLLSESFTASADADVFRRIGRLVSSHHPEASNPSGYDVVYAPFGDSAFFGLGRRSISVVVDTLHRDLPEALPPEEVAYREGWFQRITAQADRLQCNSQFVARQVARHFPHARAKTFVIANAIQDRLPRRPGRPSWLRSGRPSLFYPANAWPHKNHETLLRAYARYRECLGRIAWDLILTGHPDERFEALRELARKLGIAPYVDFRGFVPEQRYSRVWGRAGALVFPSLYEGFGIPLLEAMRTGRPILASTAGSIPEITAGAALLVDATQPETLAEGMVRITTEPALRRQLRRAGREREKAFSRWTEATKLANVILSLAAEPEPESTASRIGQPNSHPSGS